MWMGDNEHRGDLLSYVNGHTEKVPAVNPRGEISEIVITSNGFITNLDFQLGTYREGCHGFVGVLLPFIILNPVTL